MSKRRLTHREQLRKMLREAEPNSVLSAELEVVQTSLEKPRRQAITELIRLLRLSTNRDTQWFITNVLETAKDERVIRPLLRAAQAPENDGYSANYLWALMKYDCTKHLDSLVKLISGYDEPGEPMMVCNQVIRAMKGPFEPVIARKNIRKLLAESRMPIDAEMKLQSEALKLEAADFIMVSYFNYTCKVFWKERNGSIDY